MARRLNGGRRPAPARAASSLVSIVRPVCGVEDGIEQALHSGFVLDDRNYELIFCAHELTDPAVHLVRRLMAENPAVPSRLLTGGNFSSANPKLDNIVKSWLEIRGEWIVFCDDNVLLRPDYIGQLLAAWGPDTGVVSTVHIGSGPRNFWSEVECAFLNSYQARWHIAANMVTAGFAHGKTMLMRRSDLASFGGIEALASEIAEDVAVTKLVRARGMTVSSTQFPVEQPIGSRSAAGVYKRQTRWACLRRKCFPLLFLPEVLSGGLFPVLAAGVLAHALGVPAGFAMGAQAAGWYGLELIFLAHAGWHIAWSTFPAMIVRDLAIPVIWAMAWREGAFQWRDKPMQPSLAPDR